MKMAHIELFLNRKVDVLLTLQNRNVSNCVRFRRFPCFGTTELQGATRGEVVEGWGNIGARDDETPAEWRGSGGSGVVVVIITIELI